MNNITSLFIDIGGVCLTNGWDYPARKNAADHFFLDFEETEKFHKEIFEKFERGEILLKEYLDKVIFFKERTFTHDDFFEFIKTQTKPIKQSLDLIEKIKALNKYFMATINNESLELNLFRINNFRLYNYFTAFFSSCFIGSRKPEIEIYKRTLNILHKEPSECLFIDDREENIKSAASLGIGTIHLIKTEQLESELSKNGII